MSRAIIVIQTPFTVNLIALFLEGRSQHETFTRGVACSSGMPSLMLDGVSTCARKCRGLSVAWSV